MLQLTPRSKRQPEKKSSLEKLLTLNQHKIKLGLNRINKIIKRLKITQKPNIKYLTVNGTSGKNSIIQIFKSILIQYRLRYAATYSPHLVSITERFEHNQNFIKLNKLNLYFIHNIPKFVYQVSYRGVKTLRRFSLLGRKGAFYFLE